MDKRTFLTDLHAPEHYPEAIGEAFTSVFIPRGVRDIILDYWDKSIKPIEKIDKANNTVKQYEDFKLFGRNLHFFIDCNSLSDIADIILQDEKRSLSTILSKSADLILKGQDGIRNVLHLINEMPILIRIKTIGKDPLNRRVEGTLLQIAAMAGDVNLSKTDTDGVVEKLKFAGKLSDEETRDHLEVITGHNAIIANKKRNQLTLNALEKFIKSFLQVRTTGISEFKEFQQECISFIVEYGKDLQNIRSETITCGFVFDPEIISDSAKILEKNVKNFGGWFGFYSAMFRINGYGMLQRQLSSRDSQMVNYQMDKFIEKHYIPGRLYDLLSHDYPGCRIGYEYYINYSGDRDMGKGCDLVAPSNAQELQVFGIYTSIKRKSIEKLTKVEEKKAGWLSYFGFR